MKCWLINAVSLALGCIMLTACGGSADQSTNSSSASSSSQSSESQSYNPGVQNSGTGPQTVHIFEGEMDIKSDVTNFKVGVPYHFEVTNKGKVLHEFTIAKKVPGGDEDSRDAASVKDVDNIEPGHTATFDFTFKEPAPPAGMEFECSYPGHYEMGMRMDITVK
jgi:uncharacterized cupredoxin-like copper-binding protein